MNVSSVAIEGNTPAYGWRDFQVVLVLLAAGLFGLGVIFRAEAIAAVLTWKTSTAYNHCFLVLPITLYMIWDRWSDLRVLRALPSPAGALFGVAPAVGWLAAERLGIMEGRQLMVIMFVEVLFLAVLGWRFWRAIAGPLLYLFFLVPFGEFLVPRLQDITAVFIAAGLGLTDIPAYVDGRIIEIPAGVFYVAEACAGLRFLVASVAFGVLYALIMYRSPLRRTVFILLAIVVPIVANGLRALGVVLLGHAFGSAEAAVADHILYGWIFFSIVILLLTVLGLPFREDEGARQPSSLSVPREPISLRSGMTAVVVAVVVASISPALAVALSMMPEVDRHHPIVLNLPDDCQLVSQVTERVRAEGGQLTVTHVQCEDVDFQITVTTFSLRSSAGPILLEMRRLVYPRDSEDVVAETAITGPQGESTNWRLFRGIRPSFVALAGLWIGGEASGVDFSMRIQQAIASLSGSYYVPAVVVVSSLPSLDSVGPAVRHLTERRMVQFGLAQVIASEQLRVTISRPPAN